jgi:hypothetical protein
MTGDFAMMDAQFIANLDALLPEQERALEEAARNVKLGLERDSVIYRGFTQLQFFILTVDFDMRVMLRALLVSPQNRLTAEKFLALTLEESDESMGKMVQGLLRPMHSLPKDSGAHLFDRDKVIKAYESYKTATAPMRADKDFAATLRLIRNTVSGHIVGDKVGVQNGAIWVLTRAGISRDADGVLKSQIVAYAVATLLALLRFSKNYRRLSRSEVGAVACPLPNRN